MGESRNFNTKRYKRVGGNMKKKVLGALLLSSEQGKKEEFSGLCVLLGLMFISFLLGVIWGKCIF